MEVFYLISNDIVEQNLDKIVWNYFSGDVNMIRLSRKTRYNKSGTFIVI